MTLKEQIIKLQTYKMHEGEDTVYIERDDVLKALEQEPCYNPDEWCHDCKEYDQERHCCPRFNNVIRNTVEEIKQQKTGHWKVVSDRYGDNAYICECSECEDTVWVYKGANRKWNYCPNCGARMIEPQAESEDKR